MGIFISVIILVMYMVTMYAGWKRGFIKQGEYYIGLVMGLLVTSLMGAFLHNIIRDFAITVLHINNSIMLYVFGWLIKGLTFGLIFMGCRILIKKTLKSSEKTTVDKIIGMIFGFLKTTLLIWLLNTLLSRVDVFMEANSYLAQSSVYEFISRFNIVTFIF